ncbi:hypothetical protein bcgnr5369_04650 [Bacillus cereus]|uniref:Uncharacterized protein n=3 Tax=Bacillus cereus group TaxID=86661 RepID=A0A9X6WIQ8_BACTU|nr:MULTISPECIES: hypothetical protein [Bacillus cereus group]PFJ30555.1 hypothetical protein COJ15_30845 [Bacillus thuringiensis]PGP11970.1 hypothetical protein COA01_34690 [Bacillus cereus]
MKHLEKEVREIFETNKLKALVDKEIDNVEDFLKQAELIYICNEEMVNTTKVFLEEIEKMDYKIMKDSIRNLTVVIFLGNYFILDGHEILKEGVERELDIYTEVNNIEEFENAVTVLHSPTRISSVKAEIRKGTDGRGMDYLLIKERNIGIVI